MPVPMLRSLADQYNCSVETAEKAWDECKSGIKPGEGGKGYGLVVECVKAKLSKRSRKAAVEDVKKVRGE